MKTNHILVLIVMVVEVKGVIFSNPMKCIQKSQGSQQCIISKMDDTNVTDLIFQEMISKDTEDLIIFCTSRDDNTFSKLAGQHLTNLHKLMFWNCRFIHFPIEGLLNLKLLSSLSFHTSVSKYGDQVPKSLIDIKKYSIKLLCSLHWLTDIGITGHNIQSITQTLPCFNSTCCQHISLLNLTANDISAISKSTFEGLENVTILDLSRNAIKTLLADAFSRLKILTKLVLTLNPLHQISIQVFGLNRQLTEIDINYVDYLVMTSAPDNMIAFNWREKQLYGRHLCTEYTDLDSQHFKFLTNVTSISMCITRWNFSNVEFVKSLKSVKKLALKYPDSVTGKNWAGDMPEFVKLVLVKMTNLTHLSIEVEGLRVYPTTFENVINLRHLTLKKVKLPLSVFDCPQKLQVLKIDFQLPFSNQGFASSNLHVLFNFPQLKELYVSNLFNVTVGGLNNLKIYEQKGTELIEVPHFLCSRENSYKLMQIRLQFNWISLIWGNDFEMCRNLQYLDLSSNVLSNVLPYEFSKLANSTDSAFFNLKNLTHLNLSNNTIQVFDFSVIPHSLILLDLSYNYISVFTDKFKVGNSLQLQFLNLYQNQILHFEPNILPVSLTQLLLGHGRDNYEKKWPVSVLNTDNLSHLQNLEVFILKHARKLIVSGTISPSAKGIYFHTEDWCQEYSDYQVCAIYVKNVTSSISFIIHNFRVYSFYDNVNMQNFYCEYHEEYVCIENRCHHQKQVYVTEGHSLKVLNCSTVQFPVFPLVFPKGLVVDYLFLDGNNMTTIPSNSLKTLHESVKVLFLNNSHIAVIQNDAFDSHNGIRELHLENNYISSIPDRMMPRSPLQFLYLQNNRLIQLGDLSVFLFTSLQELHLENNLFKSVPKWLCGKFDVSQKIYLQNNPITVFSKLDFKDCRNLEYLNLTNNSIGNLGSNYFMSEVAHFSVRHNMEEMGTILDLSENKIVGDVLTSFITGFPIDTLFLQNNKIQHLDFFDQHTSLFRLRKIKLDNNSIGNLGERIFQGMPNLKEVSLKNNLVTELHGQEFTSDISSIVLEVLNLANNRLWSMDKNSFIRCISLKVLYLSGNQLTALNVTIFDKLENLKLLFLNHNKFETLSTEFSKLNRLEELHLNNNLLSSLSLGSFQNLRSLLKLFLHNNKLVSPNVWHWQLPKNIRTVNLLNNSLTCDCGFMPEFFKWVNDMKEDRTRDIQIDHCVRDDEVIKISEFDVTICVVSYELVLGICMGILVVLFVSLCVLYYKRLEVQVWVYSRYGIRLFYKNKEEDKWFDVFIAYSSEDENFVINDLLPGLRNYRICIHFKDFLPGAFITESISQAVENSCRTLLVFSPNFLQSPWCKFEFKMAHNKALQDRCCRLILLLLEDVDEANMDQEQKAYLRTNTYLRCDDKMFWQKLRFALPDARGNIQEGGQQQQRELVELPEIT